MHISAEFSHSFTKKKSFKMWVEKTQTTGYVGMNTIYCLLFLCQASQIPKDSILLHQVWHQDRAEIPNPP